MKKNSIILLLLLVTSISFTISCSDNSSSSNSNDSYLTKKGPDECNQDEYEDEGKELSTEIDEECAERHVANVPANKEALYSIRDSILSNYPRGNKYIDDYYTTSKIVKDYSKFTIGNFVDVIELMPYIYSAQEKFNDKTYTGVIVSPAFRDKLITVLTAYKKLSNNSTYSSLINSFISDVNNVTNKNKAAVILFMKYK